MALSEHTQAAMTIGHPYGNPEHTGRQRVLPGPPENLVIPLGAGPQARIWSH